MFRRLKAERLSRRLLRALARVRAAFEHADNPLLSPTAQRVADAEFKAADRDLRHVERSFDIAIRMHHVTHREANCLRYAGRA